MGALLRAAVAQAARERHRHECHRSSHRQNNITFFHDFSPVGPATDGPVAWLRARAMPGEKALAKPRRRDATHAFAARRRRQPDSTVRESTAARKKLGDSSGFARESRRRLTGANQARIRSKTEGEDLLEARAQSVRRAQLVVD